MAHSGYDMKRTQMIVQMMAISLRVFLPTTDFET